MKSRYKTIEELVIRIDERNSNKEANILLGVSIDKCFIPSVANTIGTDLTKYKLIRKNDFAVSLMQVSRDSRIPIARQTEYEVAMMSPAYPIFRVKNPYEILPEYLEMWFKRDEFDREAAFIAVGGVRGSMPWNEFAQMQVYVPKIERQREIVKSYKIISDRIALKRKINDNLQQQAFTIYKDTIGCSDKNAILSDIVDIIMGTSPEGETLNSDGIGTVFYQGKTDFGFRFPTARQYTTAPKRYAQLGDILMSVRAPVGSVNIATENCSIGRGLAAIRPKSSLHSYTYYTMIELDVELNKFNDEGTVFGSISKDDLFALPIVCVNDDIKIAFEKKVSQIDALIKINEVEITKLEDMVSLLLSKLTN